MKPQESSLQNMIATRESISALRKGADTQEALANVASIRLIRAAITQALHLRQPWQRPSRRKYRGRYMNTRVETVPPCGCIPEMIEELTNEEIQTVITHTDTRGALIRVWESGNVNCMKCGDKIDAIDIPERYDDWGAPL